MAILQGIYITHNGPRDGKTAKLWNAGSFASPPEKNTALPSGSPLQSTTTGTAHGGNGQYRFTGVTTGSDYYVSVEDGETITYDAFSLVAAGSATGNVKNEGAVGDGITDDTTAINTALANTAYGRVFFPPGTYLVTGLTINGRTGLVVEGEGATIQLSGTGSSGSPIGLRVTGTTRDLTLRNLRFLGSNTASDYHAGIWANSATIEGLRIENCHFENVAAGVWLSRTSGTWEHLLISHCYFENIVGTGANQGLGVYYSNASSLAQYLTVRDCEFFDCDQHAIQFANGKALSALHNWVLSHRSSVATAAVVAAITVRGTALRVEGNYFHTSSDGAIHVKPASGAIVRGVQIRGNVIDNPSNNVADITLGTSDPATDGAVSHAIVADNYVNKDGRDAAAIDVFTALRSTIRGNVLELLNLTAANIPFIELEGAGEGAGTANYTDDVTISENVGLATLSGGTANGIRLEAAFCTSGADVRFFGNSFAGAAANFQSVASITNDNLVVDSMTTSGLTFDSSSQLVELDEGPLDFNAGMRLTRIETSVGITLTQFNTCVYVSTAGANRTINLPTLSATNTGLLIAVVKVDNAAGTVLVTPQGTDRLLHPGTVALNLEQQYESIFLIGHYNATGSFWHVFGGQGFKRTRRVTTITNADSPYALREADDFIVCDTTAGNITVIPPAQAGRQGWYYAFFKSANGNTLTIDPPGAETIEGGATLALAAGPGLCQIVQSGTDWKVVARNTANLT